MPVTRRTAMKAALAAVPLVPALASPASAHEALAHGHSPHDRTRRPTLHLAGDSTAASKLGSAAPETGWGMALPFFLHPHLAVANHALNGRSSKSFIDEGRLAAVLPLLRPGDLLLVQFGHNDSKSADPARYTEPWSTYQQHLRQYIDGARARGARPVLLTSVERRRFDTAGNAVATYGEYPAAVRALASHTRVPLVDVQAASLEKWQEVGAEPLKSYFNWLEPGEHPNYPDGVRDNTHFRPRGAIEVARMVATGLRRTGALHPRDLRRLHAPVPDEWITWPTA
ncbi:rhamnogalacturonan acetylesterase (plasmid) [Streptomyces sp. CA-294286]|uniref:rhamnogalacturonan acetylesterase n=1 Tax=Streptomyces sp. CA-294286 TaxID=3240070 RepID=UPI003D9420F1